MDEAGTQQMNGSYQQHPLSAAFPSMSESDRAALTADIQLHGQRDPITVYEGQILDGWHRYGSCLELGVTPRLQNLSDGTDPVAYVISCNLHRRHLTASQRAQAVAVCNDWLPAHRPSNSAPGAGLSTKAMAEKADVSPRTIEHAKAAQAAGLGDAVRDGKITVKQGAAIAKLPVEDRPAAVENPGLLKGPTRVAERQRLVDEGVYSHKSAVSAIDQLASIRDDDPNMVAAMLEVRAYIDSRVPAGEMVTLSRAEYDYQTSLVDKAYSDQKALEAALDAEDQLAEAAKQIMLLTEQVVALTISRDDLLDSKDKVQGQLSTSAFQSGKPENQLATGADKLTPGGMSTGGGSDAVTRGIRVYGEMVSLGLQLFWNWRRSWAKRMGRPHE